MRSRMGAVCAIVFFSLLSITGLCSPSFPGLRHADIVGRRALVLKHGSTARTRIFLLCHPAQLLVVPLHVRFVLLGPVGHRLLESAIGARFWYLRNVSPRCSHHIVVERATEVAQVSENRECMCILPILKSWNVILARIRWRWGKNAYASSSLKISWRLLCFAFVIEALRTTHAQPK